MFEAIGQFYASLPADRQIGLLSVATVVFAIFLFLLNRATNVTWNVMVTFKGSQRSEPYQQTIVTKFWKTPHLGSEIFKRMQANGEGTWLVIVGVKKSFRTLYTHAYRTKIYKDTRGVPTAPVPEMY